MQMMVTYGFMRYTYDINMYLKFRKDFISTQTYNIHTKKRKQGQQNNIWIQLKQNESNSAYQ